MIWPFAVRASSGYGAYSTRTGGRYRQRFFDAERRAIASSPLGLVAAARVFGADPSHIAKIRRGMR